MAAAQPATTQSSLRCHSDGSYELRVSFGYLLTCFHEWSFLLIFLFGTCTVFRQREDQGHRCDSKCFAAQGFGVHCYTWKHMESHHKEMGALPLSLLETSPPHTIGTKKSYYSYLSGFFFLSWCIVINYVDYMTYV